MSGRGQQGKPASPASNDKKKGSKTKPQEKKGRLNFKCMYSGVLGWAGNWKAGAL